VRSAANAFVVAMAKELPPFNVQMYAIVPNFFESDESFPAEKWKSDPRILRRGGEGEERITCSRSPRCSSPDDSTSFDPWRRRRAHLAHNRVQRDTALVAELSQYFALRLLPGRVGWREQAFPGRSQGDPVLLMLALKPASGRVRNARNGQRRELFRV
jgi:hypothetical protein